MHCLSTNPIDFSLQAASFNTELRINTELSDYCRFCSEVRRLSGKRDLLLHDLQTALLTPGKDDDKVARQALKAFADEIKQAIEIEDKRTGPSTLESTLLATFYTKLWCELTTKRAQSVSAKTHTAAKLLNLCKIIDDTASEILLESVSKSVKVIEYTGGSSSLIRKYCEELETINEALTINLNLKQPQEGFGRTIRANELLELLSHKGSHLFLLEVYGQTVGYYIVFTRDDCPHDIKRSLTELSRFNTNAAWGYIVGVTQEGRRLCSALGVNAYDALHSAVIDFAKGAEIDSLFAEVRIGEQGNLAKEKHASRGWEETERMEQHGDFPYQTLKYQVRTHKEKLFPNARTQRRLIAA